MEKLPETRGVPEISPPLLPVNPFGSPLNVQVLGSAPPKEAIACE